MGSITDIVSSKDIVKAMADIEAGNPFEYKKFFRKSGLGKKTSDQLRKTFNYLNKEKGQYLEEVDIPFFMQNFSPDARLLTPAETADFMKAANPNTGKIGFDEFFAMVEASKHED